MPRPSRSTLHEILHDRAPARRRTSSPPWFSSTSSWRWIVPMVAFETLPYCGRELVGVLGDEREHRAQVLQVEQQQALLVRDAERDVEHAFLDVVQVHQARRAAAGPSRRWWRAPDGPARRTDPRTPPEIRRAGSRSPISLARLTKASLASPTAAMPERSPLMSAANTGTPAREKPSASTCSVTVLPVPVAPVTRPCRLPSAASDIRACRSCRRKSCRPDRDPPSCSSSALRAAQMRRATSRSL